MLKKLINSLMALTMAIGIGTATMQPAEARRGGGLVAGAIVGGIVAGALIAGSRRAHARSECYRGPRRCEWHGRHCFYNRYGDYVCRGGDYRCWRPLICD